MPAFKVYLHEHTVYTSKPPEDIKFVGYSYPHFSQLRAELANKLGGIYPQLPIREASIEDYAHVHDPAYLDKLQRLARDEQPDDPIHMSIECIGYEHVLPGYRFGLGGMFEAVDQMKKGSLERGYVFCLGGHHAFADWGHGYCPLNPLAATARYAQEQGFDRVLIVDWDYHHGDGTQSIFAHDSSVYCLSIHDGFDLYMAKASDRRAGTTVGGEEVGQCNIPLLNAMFDQDFIERAGLEGTYYRADESLDAFRKALENLPWSPDLILVFSGFDSHIDDLGKDLSNWANDDFRALTRMVLDLGQKASAPVLSTQGGGYNLPVTVSAAVSHIDELATYSP